MTDMQPSRRIRRLRANRRDRSKAREAIATRAAGYCRVSSDEQAEEGHGLEMQERAIRAYAQSQNIELVDVIADAGVSGATRPAERPGFSGLWQRAAAGEFGLICVWKFDRLARNMVYSVVTANELAQADIGIRSITEPIDTSTAMGRMVFGILASMAEQEREAITERTWGGRKITAFNGKFAGGAVPYGYRSNGNGQLEIVPEEALVIRRIHNERKLGRKLQEIADGLNADGIPGKRGGTWRPSQIGYCLDNNKYRGALEYLFGWLGEEAHILKPNTHEAIVAA